MRRESLRIVNIPQLCYPETVKRGENLQNRKTICSQGHGHFPPSRCLVLDKVPGSAPPWEFKTWPCVALTQESTFLLIVFFQSMECQCMNELGFISAVLAAVWNSLGFWDINYTCVFCSRTRVIYCLSLRITENQFWGTWRVCFKALYFACSLSSHIGPSCFEIEHHKYECEAWGSCPCPCLPPGRWVYCAHEWWGEGGGESWNWLLHTLGLTVAPYQALYTGCQSSVTSFSMEGNRDSYTFGITFDNALNDP